MKQGRIFLTYLTLLLTSCFFSAHANTCITTNHSFLPSSTFSPRQTKAASWTFSGLISNEHAEHYAYFFQLKRAKTKLYGLAFVFDLQTKKLILNEKAETQLDENNIKLFESNKCAPINWQLTPLFLRFNPITNNWIFGVKNHKAKVNFNFKVDTLTLADSQASTTQELSPGLNAIMTATGPLNGHLELDGKEEFVTAKSAWFAHLWQQPPKAEKIQPQTKPKVVNSQKVELILCDFIEGTAFYTLSSGQDKLKPNVSAWRDASDKLQPSSTHAQLKKEKNWILKIPSMNPITPWTNLLEGDELILGLIGGKKPGFCFISEDRF